MRVGLFSESLLPIVNGVSVSIDILGARLSALGHEVSYFAPRVAGYADDRPGVYRFPSFNPPTMRDYPLAYPARGELFRTFQSLKLDIVHTHTPFMVGFTGLKWARELGIPAVSTNHTLYTEYAHYLPMLPPAMVRGILIWWLRRYYNRARFVIVPSAAAGRRLESYGVKTRWKAIPTALEFPVGGGQAADIRESYGLPEDSRPLVYVGRIAREKNLDMLLEAFQRVAQADARVRLILVGGGPALESCRSVAERLHIQDKVVFAGPVSHGDLPGVLKQAQVFVFPSLTETQGLAVGEAALCGVPCVAVNSGGTPEFVRDGETGYLVDDNPEEFAARVLELLADDTRRAEMARKAREFAAGFTGENMVKKVLDVYETAMAGAK